MLLVISPAKTLDFETPWKVSKTTEPDFLALSEALITDLKKLSPHDISALMSVSDKIGLLNFDRFHAWQQPFTAANAKPAVLAFKGDVYTGLEAESFDKAAMAFAQKHLRILCGLYGLLRPLDLIQAYRLEMGTKLPVGRAKDLYQFWGDKISGAINRELENHSQKVVVNLASNEYFKAANAKKINAEIITPVFKDAKNGEFKMISFFAKKARGTMAKWMMQNQIDPPDELIHFAEDGYGYNASLSKGKELVFTRG